MLLGSLVFAKYIFVRRLYAAAFFPPSWSIRDCGGLLADSMGNGEFNDGENCPKYFTAIILIARNGDCGIFRGNVFTP